MPRDEPFDQAAGLRRLLAERTGFRGLGIFGPDPGLNAIAAASLAFALTRRGEDTWVLDEATAPRNAATQLGLTPRRGLADLALGQAGLEDVLLTGPGGMRLLACDRGIEWVARTDDPRWARMGQQLAEAAPAWLTLTAPQADRPCLAHTATLKLLVLPAGKQRLPDAYAVMKSAYQRQPDGHWFILVMNAADPERAFKHGLALAGTARRFLGLGSDVLGSIPRDDKLEMAARAMRPLLEVSPASPAAAAFRSVVERLSELAMHTPSMDAESFWQRLQLFSRMALDAAYMEPGHAHHGRAFG